MVETESEPLRVDVLGPVRARRGDVEIRLGPTRQRTLFAVLALRHNRVVPREELIRAVWGDEAPATAEGSVHTYVSGLRGALEPGRPRRSASTVLPSDGLGYRLALAKDALDVTRFAELAVRASTAIERGDAAETIELANQALALWRGEPLTGLPGPFLEAQRNRLAATRLELLETRAEAALMAGRHSDLVAELTALTGANPLHEGLRGLIMIALYRCGRQADALDQFREATRVLATELGAKPSTRLAEIHQQVLTNDPALALPETAFGPVTSSGGVPAQRNPRPRERAIAFVGRDDELARLRAAVSDLAAGRGRAIWLDGEPGIGKSELLTTGLAGLDREDVEVCWGSGDTLAQRFGLGVMQECLGVSPESADPRRARLAELVLGSSSRDDVLGGGVTPLHLVDEVVDLVRQLCQDRPLALVVDDMQWVDEASMLAWTRLARATDRLPLLVVGACRPVPRTEGLDSMRETVARGGGVPLRLDRLPDRAVSELVHAIVRAAPGPGLRHLAKRAAGNPLYVQELVDALMRDRMVLVSSGTADTDESAGTAAPLSLTSALEHRLDFLTPDTVDMLRMAALLGADFRLGDLSVVLARPSALRGAVDESTTAGVLVANGDRLAFRHPLIRQALYEGTGATMRAALHRLAAQRLDHAGAPADVVARQLAAAPDTVDPWTIQWVGEHGEQVASRAPGIGLELLRRVVAACDPAHPRLVELTASLTRVMYWSGESPEREVRSVLAATRDPDLAGEMHWILACVFYRRGMNQESVDSLRVAVESDQVADVWRARCRALLAGRERMGLGEVEAAERDALTAIRDGDRFGDAFAKAYALENLWLFRAIDRDHEAALAFVDEALRTLDAGEANSAGDRTLVHLRLSLLDNRVFSLQNLDRLAEADRTLRTADDMVRRHRLPGGLTVPSAVNNYWLGRWDQVVAGLSAFGDAHGLDMAFGGLRESGPMLLLLHGVAALVAVLRDQTTDADAHLAAADELPMLTMADRENCDFLVFAEALVADRDGRPDAALIALAPVLDERYSPMMLRCQWLPDTARIAVEAGDMATARRALALCEVEARREKRPARAAAAATHCRGIVHDDPDAVLAAAEHYAAVGRPVELAHALENAAVLLARAQRADEARQTHAEAVRHYGALGASWAIRRASTRMRAAGVVPDGEVNGRSCA